MGSGWCLSARRCSGWEGSSPLSLHREACDISGADSVDEQRLLVVRAARSAFGPRLVSGARSISSAPYLPNPAGAPKPQRLRDDTPQGRVMDARLRIAAAITRLGPETMTAASAEAGPGIARHG